MKNWKDTKIEIGAIFRYYLNICSKGLRKTPETLDSIAGLQAGIRTPESIRYEEGMLQFDSDFKVVTLRTNEMDVSK
jgi:hypothetical protein